MKYIRTKETEYGCIIDLERFKAETGEECFIPEDEIVKQADTIPELCDEFIGILDNGNGSHIWYDEYFEVNEWETPEELSALKFRYAKANLSLNEILLGAIWTDKGLIYVAKLNEKGELELL